MNKSQPGKHCVNLQNTGQWRRFLQKEARCAVCLRCDVANVLAALDIEVFDEQDSSTGIGLVGTFCQCKMVLSRE